MRFDGLSENVYYEANPVADPAGFPGAGGDLFRFYSGQRRHFRAAEKRLWLKLVLFAVPLPWIACEAGWFVAEYGRQPWTIWEILPTHLSVSSLSVGSLWGSLGALVFLYTGLLIVEAWLMVRFAKLGPSSLGTGAYHHEQAAK